MTEASKKVTELLAAFSSGDQAALDKLMPLVYDELHQMARRYMRSQPQGHPLQTTALIHEAYLKLVDHRDKQWQNRAHFFAVAAQAMRHILVDYARSRHAAKRGGEVRLVSLNEAAMVSDERAAEVIALDEALSELAKLHARQSQVVEMRFFGGLTVEETAQVLKVSPDTVMRDWRMAKAWLHKTMKSEK